MTVQPQNKPLLQSNEAAAREMNQLRCGWGRLRFDR